MNTVMDLEPPKKREFEFVHNGKKVKWEFLPLTATEVEDVRASVPMPLPPEKPLDDLTVQDRVLRKRQGLKNTMPDIQDPDYQKALRQYDDDLSLEMVRAALGWDMAREKFAAEMRSRLPYGILADLIRAVNAATFALDSGLIANLSGTSNPSTEKDENS